MIRTQHRLRVLLAKPGLDGHDRGAKVIAMALRNAGMEVIYTGIRQTVDMIVEAALEEDVNVIGLSILSGAHLELSSSLMTKLKQMQLMHISVLIGGIVPAEDGELLKKMGIKGVFGPGTSTETIVECIRRIT